MNDAPEKGISGIAVPVIVAVVVGALALAAIDHVVFEGYYRRRVGEFIRSCGGSPTGGRERLIDEEEGSDDQEELPPVRYNDVIPFTEKDQELPNDFPNDTTILIISEAAFTWERLSTNKYKGWQVMRTYFGVMKDDGFNPARQVEWNWIEEDFPENQTFDLIVARSMICPCNDVFEDNDCHFSGTREQKTVINTCGGIVRDSRLNVLVRVASLLNEGGVAHLTASPTRILNVRRGPPRRLRPHIVEYWTGTLADFNQTQSFEARFVYEDENEVADRDGDPLWVFSIVIRRR